MREDEMINQLQQKMESMQKEIEQLKQQKEEKLSQGPYEKHKERLGEAQKAVLSVLQDIIADGAAGAATYISAAAFDGSGNGTGTSIIHSIDEIPEDGIAAALDVFTNPRRIAIIKLLIPRRLTAGEISKETGLVGGQLYHHLSILENAELIVKKNDRFYTDGRTQTLICGLYSVIGGMKIVR